MTTTLARPNKYAANCVRCNARIPAGDGLLARLDDGRWAADHPADCPDKPQAVAAPTVAALANEDGIYRTADGTIYKVQIAHHGSGRLYAKRLVVTNDKGTFEYEAGAVHRLRADQRLTLDDAREFGALYGICCVCGRTLTAEQSVERGIGPVCAKMFA